MTEPKSKMGPKSVLDPEEPGNKLGPENCFQLDQDWAQKAEICKVLQNRPKRVLGPKFLKYSKIGL